MSAVTAPLRRPAPRVSQPARRQGLHPLRPARPSRLSVIGGRGRPAGTAAAVAAPSTPSARAAPRLRVIERPRHRRGIVLVSSIVVLLGGAVFGAVALNAMAAAAAVEARTLEARVAEGERRYGQLVAEVAALEDPGRIRAEAVSLGLVPAGPTRHLVVQRPLPADGGNDSVPSASAAADPMKSILSLEP